ncbi:hypothetical protein GCM10027053_17750 [Intrasporangium mesophilum]
MALTIVPVTPASAASWRDVHNRVIPASPLSLDEVHERLTRNELTLAYLDGELVGNATVRPPMPDQAGVATVIVRVLPPFRRKGLGTEYLGVVMSRARELGATTVETVVLAANADGLRFAVRHGFVEVERYIVDEGAEYVDLTRSA